MTPPLDLQFVMSAPSVDDLPESRAEVAVIGRSNVGKSSLLNALSNRKNLAHTSKTPGRTQLLNCFALGRRHRRRLPRLRLRVGLQVHPGRVAADDRATTCSTAAS